MGERTERRADFIESLCSYFRLLFSGPQEPLSPARASSFAEPAPRERGSQDRYLGILDSEPDNDLDDEVARRVSEMLNTTRRLTTALRSAERGWDWNVVHLEGGERYLDVVYVSSEESQLESNRLLLELMELQQLS